MLTLPKEILTAVRDSESEALRVTDPETRKEYVIITAEMFERLSGGEWGGLLTREEQLRLLEAAGRRAGWDDPEMDVYNELDPRRP